MPSTPSRDEAWALLNEYTTNPNLIKHALAVEAGMRAYARRFGQDPELWGVVGLIHDFDYERHPTLEEHPFRGVDILRQKGWPEELCRAVLAHGRHTGEPRDTLLKRTIFAVDELAGFLIAVALVRPNRSLHEVEVSSVKKKLKDKAFARTVNRDDIYDGAQGLGIPLDEHIGFMIEALRGIAPQLGLDGSGTGGAA